MPSWSVTLGYFRQDVELIPLGSMYNNYVPYTSVQREFSVRLEVFCSGSLGQILKQTCVSNFLTVILKPGHLTWIAFPKALFLASFKKNLKINHTVIYNNIRYYLLKNIFFNSWISGSGRDSEGNHSGQTSTSNLSKSTSLNSWFSSLTI